MDRDNGTGNCRIMTYNIHRCVGTDGKLSPPRIADVIAACKTDIVALQEVDVGRSRTGYVDQAAAIGKILGMQVHFHPALRVLDEQYGDAILTRSPSALVKAGLLPGPKPSSGHEPRGAIWVRAEMAGQQVDVVNTHLGLTRAERMMQVGALIGPEWIGGRPIGGTMILAGDFNVGRRTRSYRRLAACLDPARDKTGRRQLRTFPSRLPVLALDHIFASEGIEIVEVGTVRTPLTRVASDHLPLVADFRLTPSQVELRERAA